MSASLVNGLLVAIALVMSAAGAGYFGSSTRWVSDRDQANAHSAEKVAFKRKSAVTDARGVTVTCRPYARIVSLSPVADHILLRLVEPGRLVGATHFTLSRHPDAWRFKGIPALSTSRSLEGVLQLEPDLVVVSRFADESYMSRLRDSGIAVFDVGEMRGVETTRGSIEDLGRLLNLEDRASRLERAFSREHAGLRRRLGGLHEVEGIFLSVLGDQLFGGTAKSSYADLLRLGGVRDLAQEQGFVGWPRYSVEQLVEMNPPFIVMPKGGALALCNHDILRALDACSGSGHVIEMPRNNHSDAGLGLLDAAHDLQVELGAILDLEIR